MSEHQPTPVADNEHCKECIVCHRQYNWLVSEHCYHCYEKEIDQLKQCLNNVNELIDEIWEKEPGKTEILDMIQRYLKKNEVSEK